jgi:hypothetical protein
VLGEGVAAGVAAPGEGLADGELLGVTLGFGLAVGELLGVALGTGLADGELLGVAVGTGLVTGGFSASAPVGESGPVIEAAGI